MSQLDTAEVIRRLVRVIHTRFGMDVTFAVGTAGDPEADACVPLRHDGRVHGTLCCIAKPGHELREADLTALRILADLAAEYLEDLEQVERLAQHRRQVVLDVLREPGAMVMVYQPLRDLRDGRVVAVEALARFPRHSRGPDWFFREAATQDLGARAELVALRHALARLPDIPAPVRLNVNVSAETLSDAAFLPELAGVAPGRLVLEVTEHSVIDDYGVVTEAVAELAARGIRTSIDDVGMGWSGLNRILECCPDELKLDAAVIRDVHLHPIKQALVETLCAFADRAGVDVVAEGIETADELHALRGLGILVGQGYHLGRPGDLEAIFASPVGVTPR